MQESIFKSALRSFFVALFAMIGICIGFIILMVGVFSSSTSMPIKEVETNFSYDIVPNAEGVRKMQAKDAPVILKMDLSGVIGAESLTMEKIRLMLVESREGDLKDNRVKALLLNINSPGGTVIDADGIYHAIKAYKEQYKVPVYGYIDGLCASGGMYIAAAADKIYSSDVSLVGSIGVLSPPFMNFSKLMEKVGVESLTLIAGKGKDEMNPLRPWVPGEEDNFQTIVNYYYNRFVDIMTLNRPINKESLIKEYGAKVFDAPTAQIYGYIDASGYSLNDTLKEILKHLEIKDDAYQVIEMKSKSWWSDLFKSEFNFLLNGKITHDIKLPPEFDSKLSTQFLYLYRP